MGRSGRMMRVLLFLEFFLISVFSLPQQERQALSEAQPIPISIGGKCPQNRQLLLQENKPITHEDILLTCTECTPLRENLEKAFNECNGDALDSGSLSRQANGKGKSGKGKSGKGKGQGGKGKGKGGKGKGGKDNGGKGKGGKGKGGKGKGGKPCPSVDEVMENLRSKSKKDSCVFKSLGWIDESGKPITEVITTEISILPDEVASQLSKDDVETCAIRKAREWSLRPKRRRCDATYTQADRSALLEYELTVAGMKCMKTMMRSSCNDFVNKPQAVVETLPFPIGPPSLVGGSGEDDSGEQGWSNELGGPSGENWGSSEEDGLGGNGHGGGHVGPPGHGHGHGGSSEEGGLPFIPGHVVQKPPISSGPFPFLPQPYPFPTGGGGFARPNGPGNFQQVIVEQPNLPPPKPHLPGQLLPEKWPSNLVAALVPADWVAENFQFQFGSTDEYDYYDYYYDYDGDYAGEDYYYNYDDEYTEDYADYYDDEYYDDSSVVDEPISGGAIAVNLPSDITAGNTEYDSSVDTEAPSAEEEAEAPSAETEAEESSA